MKNILSALALLAGLASTAHAAPPTIADAPLNTGGVTLVRPNVMLLLDNSGSMEWQYMPDYVDDARLCDNGSAAKITSLNSGATACNYSGWTNLFRIGSYNAINPAPPAYSPDINQQYYNPEVRYSPPVKHDLTTYPSMDGSTTSNGRSGSSGTNWKAVPSDGYGKYTTGTFNIQEEYPSYYYCDQRSSESRECAHDTSYNFPELNSGTNPKRTQATANSAPYYYRLAVSYFCRDEQMTDCVKATVPTGTYIYPARVRFCKDIAKTDCQKNYDADKSYTIASYLHLPTAATSSTPATGANLTINVTNVGTSASTAAAGGISSIMFDGTNYGSVTWSAANANTSYIATQIRSKLNNVPGYTATASGSSVVLTANTAGPSENGKVVTLNSTPSITAGTKWTVTINNAYSRSLAKNNKLGNITIDGVKVNAGSVITNSTSGNAAFAAATLNTWSAGTNGYTISQAKSSNNMVLTIQCTDSALCSLVNDNASVAVAITTPSGSVTKLANGGTSVTKAVGAYVVMNVDGNNAGYATYGPTQGGVNYDSGIDRGNWTRTYIESGNTYARNPNRTDCVNESHCTYQEEMTNFANWFAYYRFRLNMAKTATGQAFSKLNDNYRVGYIPLSSSTVTVGVAPFDATDLSSTAVRKKWYDTLYAQKTSGSTPNRAALARVGRYYAGKSITATLPDPMEYSCQKNYTILVTDGYWNGNGGVDINGTSLDAVSTDSDADNPWNSRESGVFDGNAAKGTLADIAQYYYITDLRTSGSFSKNNVPTNSADQNNMQHMNTYTMGLGIDGLMAYRKDYKTALSGDYFKITTGSTGCTWESSLTKTCNWPTPVADKPTAVDDLWHAAVNGRGQYFSARSPKEAADGITQALSDVVSVTGSAAASATSSPNVTQTDNFIYSSTFQTNLWDGEVTAQRINYQTGAIEDTVEWKASDKVNAQADALCSKDSNDTCPTGKNRNARTLLTMDTSASTYDKSKPFTYENLSTAERAWFNNHCTSKEFGQCAENLIDTGRISYVDSARNVVDFLRGHNDADVFSVGGLLFGYLDLFRDIRVSRLGDTVNAVPLFISKPQYTFDFALPSGHEKYKDFIARVHHTCDLGDTTCNANPPAKRPGVLYMASNDGMLHGFHGDNGTELFGYIPRTTMPEMWRLADKNYATHHRYFVDGSPVSMDITSSDGKWKTILVGGYRSGGSGYYALDVTLDPNDATHSKKPRVLWEVCNDSALCQNPIANLGMSFGNPVITRMPEGSSLAGRWVVLISSGYNNVPGANTQPTATASRGGDGKGYLYVLDATTGAVLKTYATGEGSVTDPLNLGKVSALAVNFYYNATSTLAYIGDLRGNIWRFDLAKEPSAKGSVYKIAKLQRKTGATETGSFIDQPITTRMEIGTLPNSDEPILYVTTGQYLSLDDLTDNNVQSLYALRDPYFQYTGLPDADIPAYNAAGFYGNPRAYKTGAAQEFVKRTVVDKTVTKGGVTTTVRQIADLATGKNVTLSGANGNAGWYLDFPDKGERVSLDPLLVLGTLTISSNVVNSDTADPGCEVGGYSWLYQLDYSTGGKVPTSPDDAVAFKVPGAIVVGTVAVRLPSGLLKLITTTATGQKIPYGLNVNSSTMMGRRVSWREISEQAVAP